MVKLIARETAENLSIKEWGKARLDIVQDTNGESFIVVHSLRRLLVDEVFFYDNDNMLLRVSSHDVGSRSGYILLMPNTFTKIYAEKSETDIDDKYRKVVEYDKDGEELVSLINE